MNNTKTYKNTLHLIEQWEKELTKYDLDTLAKKPTDESWSLGQVYNHLISATVDFHLKQFEICLQSAENKSKRKNFKGFVTYHVLKSIPPIKIKVPATDEYTPKQPSSKTEIINGFNLIKTKMKSSLTLLERGGEQGKTAHPGFSFLNADEWYKLVEMHFRHHLRQKNSIDSFLMASK